MPRKYRSTPTKHINGWIAENTVHHVNKKKGIHDPVLLEQLQQSGWVVPRHWRNLNADKRFIAWDGEGITYPSPMGEEWIVPQSYVLFGSSEGHRVVKPDLGTEDCFHILLLAEKEFPDAIHVGFALKYDVNMMLKDLSVRQLMRIYKHNVCYWEGYRIEYRPGKWIAIRSPDKRYSVRLFDVFGFFQSSFVAAIGEFLGTDDPDVRRIVDGKKARSSFTFDELETFIVPYWEAELRMMVRLMDALRGDLRAAGYELRWWHGPGAVANETFKRFGVKQYMADVLKREIPKEVNRAAQYAYAGGRFEIFKCGHYANPVWEYDINSAYPAGIAKLPDLAKGYWRYSRVYEPGKFAVWHVRYDFIPQIRDGRARLYGPFAKYPLFCRGKNGTVSFPPFVETWVWEPEAQFVPEYVIEGYIFEESGDRPFTFIAEMYEQRQQWKKEGNSAERAYKLALNSIYGKMAQRVGWTEENPVIPKWHQLEWAGWVTSYARSMIWAAITLNPDAIIAVETDAVFSTEQLDLPTSNRLGDWKADKFESITYIQNGLYYGEKRTEKGVKAISKYRGYDKESLPYSAETCTYCREGSNIEHRHIMDYLSDLDRSGNVAPLFGVTTRFIGLGIAIHTEAVWRSWETEKREVSIGGDGKRAHMNRHCPECKNGMGLSEGLHSLFIPSSNGGKSYPHDLPWQEGNKTELRKIDELWRW